MKARLKQANQLTWRPAASQAKPIAVAVKTSETKEETEEKKLIIGDLAKTVRVALILGAILGAAVIWLKP